MTNGTLKKTALGLGLCLLGAIVWGCDDGGNSGPAEYEGDDPDECKDRADNDRDGLFDCDDPDCESSPVCDGSDNSDNNEADTTPKTKDSDPETQDTSEDEIETDDPLPTDEPESDNVVSSDPPDSDSPDSDPPVDTEDTEDTGDTPIDTDSPDSDEPDSSGTVLYDGETVSFTTGEAWDSGSSISESTASPHSSPNHIHAEIVTSDGWGAVVYYFYSHATEDWTDATSLSVQAKGDSSVELALVTIEGEDYGFGSSATLNLSSSYQSFDIDVASLAEDVDLTQVAGLILYGGSGEFAVDIDDIVVYTGAAPDVTDTEEPDTEEPESDTGDLIDTETDEYAPSAEVHYFGRFDMREPDSPGCAWSNCGFGVQFEGDSLNIQLSGAGGVSFQIFVDGEDAGKITTAGGEWNSAPMQTYRVIDGLESGEHDVQLYRNPEAMFGVVKFHGFEAPGGQLIESPFPFSHKIEIIGDSISAGYGNDGCPFGPEKELGASAYGPLAARQVDAVAHVQAWSGKGMVMSNEGSTNQQMPELYGLALPNDAQTTWDYNDYIPDVVIINLGTNDFNGGVDSNEYIDTYEDFILRLQGYYPDAYILCAVNSSGDAFSDEIDEIISDLDDPNVEKINLGSPNMLGCQGHPDTDAHIAMAGNLVARLQAELGW